MKPVWDRSLGLVCPTEVSLALVQSSFTVITFLSFFFKIYFPHKIYFICSFLSLYSSQSSSVLPSHPINLSCTCLQNWAGIPGTAIKPWITSNNKIRYKHIEARKGNLVGKKMVQRIGNRVRDIPACPLLRVTQWHQAARRPHNVENLLLTCAVSAIAVSVTLSPYEPYLVDSLGCVTFCVQLVKFLLWSFLKIFIGLWVEILL